ncbi:tyrosine-protein kinase STK-like [Glandiceps talaboti]
MGGKSSKQKKRNKTAVPGNQRQQQSPYNPEQPFPPRSKSEFIPNQNAHFHHTEPPHISPLPYNPASQPVSPTRQNFQPVPSRQPDRLPPQPQRKPLPAVPQRPVPDFPGHHGAIEGEGNYYVSVFAYSALNEEDLSFQKGERFKIVEKGNGPWWIAKSLVGAKEGYVPSNYIEPEYEKSEDWFFGDINRRDAERGLMMRGNERGTFLIRESERFPGSYTLSVLDNDPREGRVCKHFRIKAFDKGGFYIATKMSFKDLPELVRYYKEQSHGLPTRLTKPCRKVKPMLPGISWETPRSALQMDRMIGDGQFGEVWRGIWNRRTPVAVKKMKEGSMLPSEFLKEAEIMKNLRHDHLLQLLAVCSDREPIFIVTELMPNGSLLIYLREQEGMSMNERQLIDSMAQVAAGMAYLESNKYIHRDLAARNVLVGDNYLCKVADFGLTRLINGEYIARKDARFPVKWTSPEAAKYQKFTIKSDVWSFGVLMFEIITKGQVPYAAMSNTDTLTNVCNGYRMPKPMNCPQALYDIMLKCWEYKPEDRPTFDFLFDYLDSFGVSSEDAYQ